MSDRVLDQVKQLAESLSEAEKSELVTWLQSSESRQVDLAERLYAKRDEVLATAERYGARDVRIFGSVAPGEARPDSDLDLLVRFDPERSLLDHAGLIVELEALLGCKVDIGGENGLRPHIRERVLHEARPL